MLDPDPNPILEPNPKPKCISVPVLLRKKVAVPVPQHFKGALYKDVIVDYKEILNSTVMFVLKWHDETS
jgi:hypothetical protein